MLASGLPAQTKPILRVCADPNNMPFSNSRQQGFENHLARLAARDLGMRIAFVWWPQHRGFVRNTLNAGACDVMMEVPSSYNLTLNTRPYYQSSYVLVSRRNRHLRMRSLDDPALKKLRIGVHIVGEDATSQALANRGLVRNVVGYSITGDYSKPNPPAELINAVSRGDIDVAIAWGPLAGYFARNAPAPLKVVPLCVASTEAQNFPFTFAISMGVRKDAAGEALQRQLNSFIHRRQPEIRRLLLAYGVPLTTKTNNICP